MWRHGIHLFREVLRSRLPESFEHVLALIYIAHSMMPHLYDIEFAYKDTWIECMSNLLCPVDDLQIVSYL